EGMRRYHPVIVVTGSDQGCRIFNPRLHIVNGRIAFQVFEHLLAVVSSSIIISPTSTRGESMVSQHVHYSYSWQCHLYKVRALGHGSSNQQPSVGTSPDGEIVAGSVSFTDQVLGSGYKVIKNI